MEYKNEFDNNGLDISDGRRAEENFKRLFENRFGVAPLKTEEDDDKYCHIDFYMQVPTNEGNIHTASVDVKSWKQEPNDVWIEFVSYGRLGWLYGEANYIAFETPDEKGFIIVDREELVKLVERVCVTNFTNNLKYALFRPLIRGKGKNSNKFDLVTKIPRSLLYSIKHWILKDGNYEKHNTWN